MAKRVGDRYSSAYDMAEALRQFTAEQSHLIPSEDITRSQSAVVASVHSGPAVEESDSQPGPGGIASTPPESWWEKSKIKIVPKGLRSFDSHDADFFLELLPGPRDRHGLPDSLRFWKTQLEQQDPTRHSLSD